MIVFSPNSLGFFEKARNFQGKQSPFLSLLITLFVFFSSNTNDLPVILKSLKKRRIYIFLSLSVSFLFFFHSFFLINGRLPESPWDTPAKISRGWLVECTSWLSNPLRHRQMHLLVIFVTTSFSFKLWSFFLIYRSSLTLSLPFLSLGS